MSEILMEKGEVKRAGRVLSRIRPDRAVVRAKGYGSKKIRRYLRKRGIGVMIARQKRQRLRGRFDKEDCIASVT